MPYTMLIVDDSRVSRLMIRNVVVAQKPEWRLVEAASGDEAIELAKTESFDVISMDLNMPGMDGIEAATQLRLIQPESVIVLLTANIQAAVRERAEAAACISLPSR